MNNGFVYFLGALTEQILVCVVGVFGLILCFSGHRYFRYGKCICYVFVVYTVLQQKYTEVSSKCIVKMRKKTPYFS